MRIGSLRASRHAPIPKVRLFKQTDAHPAPAVDSTRRDELLVFQRHAGIRFKELRNLNLAFCHRSYANEAGGGTGNNERLEFFGDSVLGLIVAEYLYKTLPDRAEGELARIKSFVVSEATLSNVARDLRVDNFILIGRGEEFSGGRTKKAILADAMEAIIGAYFLDSGYREAERFVLAFMVPEIEKVLDNRHEKDYKTLLQELVQKKFKSYPKYVVSRKTGPDHDRVFWIDVDVDGKNYGPGKGSNKKQAEQAAAAIAYKRLTGGRQSGGKGAVSTGAEHMPSRESGARAEQKQSRAKRRGSRRRS